MQAAQYGRVPIVGLWGGILLHHSDIRLPYCGHMIIAGAAVGTDHEGFTEGTADKRTVRIYDLLPYLPSINYICMIEIGTGEDSTS